MIPLMLCVASIQVAKPLETEILLGGTTCARNTYSVGQDGSFVSVTTGKVQGYDLESKLKVTFTKGVPTDLDFAETLGQGTKVLQGMSYVVKDGKAKLNVTGQKPTDISVKLSIPMTANFHPQLIGGISKIVDWKKRQPQEISVFAVNNATTLKGSILPTEDKEVDVAGSKTVVHFAKFKFASLETRLAVTEDGRVVGFDVPTQKFQQVLSGVKNLFEDPMAKYPELSQSKFETSTEELLVPMRDGTVLSTLVTKPTAKGKFPTILTRTPYGKASMNSDADSYARRGYVYVAQDTRGTGKSKGDFDPFVSEQKDGFDTVDWISRQSWSDGGVGMIGGSYAGLVQWSAAVEGHPALKCIVPQVSPPGSAMWNLPYENGVFNLLPDLWWLRLVDDPKGMNLLAAFNPVKNLKGMLTLPLQDVDNKVLGWNSKNFDRWLTRETSKDWSGWDFETKMASVKIPVLHISGWFDGDEIGTQRNWQILRSAGHNQQWLIYGPWTHAFNTTTSLGDEDFGARAKLDLDPLYLRWFDTWLKGKSVGIQDVSKVKYFAMGANRWHESGSWPPIESREESLEFEFGTVSLGAKSNSKLVSKTKKATSATYTYDPGKERLQVEAVNFSEAGSMRIKPENLPKEWLVLRSEVLETDKLITGPIEVSFDFKCTAKDTDFYATLFAVTPDGKMFSVTQPGKFRASYLSGIDAVRALEPGKSYRAKFQLWDSAYQYKKGDRIAVCVRSSMFPMTARNLGTAEPIATGTKMLKQTNTILSSATSPGQLRYWTR